MGSKKTLALLLVALGSLTASAAGAAVGGGYFPLEPGNRWLLRDVERGTAITVSVAADRAPGSILHGFPGTADLRVRVTGTTVEAWDPASDRWEPFLRLGAPVGTRYSVNLSHSALWRGVAVTVASRAAIVKDARGRTLRNCVRLALLPPKSLADAGIEELVFAPGIGLVSVTEITIAGPRRSVLASFRS